jgi:hypothetical protein
VKIIVRKYLDQGLKHRLWWQLLLEFLRSVFIMMESIAHVHKQKPRKQCITAHEIVGLHRGNFDLNKAILLQILDLRFNKLSLNFPGSDFGDLPRVIKVLTQKWNQYTVYERLDLIMLVAVFERLLCRGGEGE